LYIILPVLNNTIIPKFNISLNLIQGNVPTLSIPFVIEFSHMSPFPIYNATLNINTASLSVDDLLANTTSITSTTAIINLSNINSQTVSVSTSGDIIAQKITSNTFMIDNEGGTSRFSTFVLYQFVGNTTTGDMIINDFKSQYLDVHANSGNLAFDRVSLKAIWQSNSGNNQSSSHDINDRATITTTSGEIDIFHFVTSDYQIASELGDIFLLLAPNEFSGSFELISTRGQVEIDAPNLKFDQKNDAHYKKGQVGSGVQQIKASNNFGRVRVLIQ